VIIPVTDSSYGKVARQASLLAMMVLCGLPGDPAHAGPRQRVCPPGGPDPSIETADPAGSAQAIACPTYWPPSQSADWDAYAGAVPAASIAILNLEVTTDYTDAFVRNLQAKGLVVIGYVETAYMAVDAGAAIDEVHGYYAAYPTIDGIFFDEVVSAWTAASENYYTALHDAVKGMRGKTLVVLNFGVPHDETFMGICDISLNWEATWSAYDAWSGLSASAWERNYPSDRFWHLVHHCPSDHLAEAIDKSRRRTTARGSISTPTSPAAGPGHRCSSTRTRRGTPATGSAARDATG
jgi:Spherulation-specific family 4